ILSRYPQLRGIVTDLDHVTAGAEARIAKVGLSERCSAIGGDFFKSVPAGGDAYILKNVIHDWNDEAALKILKNVRAAIGPKRGKLLLVEFVLPPANQPGIGKVVDIQMLLLTGGRERTEDEYRTLLDRGGFQLVEVTATKSPMCIIEGANQ